MSNWLNPTDLSSLLGLYLVSISAMYLVRLPLIVSWPEETLLCPNVHNKIKKLKHDAWCMVINHLLVAGIVQLVKIVFLFLFKEHLNVKNTYLDF